MPYPPNKGEKIRTFHQIEYLLGKGHDIFLCFPYTSDNELGPIQHLNKQYGVQTKYHKIGKPYLRYISGLLLNKPLSVSNFYSMGLQKKLDALIKKESFNNIVCTSSSMAEYIFSSKVLANHETRPKLIMDFMDLDSDKWRQYSENSVIPFRWIYRRESLLLSSYERKIVDFFDSSFFISEAEVELFCQNSDCPKKPLAIGNGIDIVTFKPASQPANNKDPVFIFTGVMDYKPNIDAVLWFAHHVWPLITQTHSGSRFIIAGMNPVQSVMELEKVKGIEVTGFVDDILPYYHQSNFFVAPLRIARGVQNKVLQAFACGLPVISTSMGAEGIECTDKRDIMIADTPEAFYGCIDELNSNKVLYQSVKKFAIDLVENHFSWDAKLSKLKDILDTK